MGGERRRRLTVHVRPELLRWARERAGLSLERLKKPFPKIDLWERGEAHPTLKQLERLARMLRVPLGFLFLDSPPDEILPIPDLRTMARTEYSRPSPELLDTIYMCQKAQEWYRDYLASVGERPIPFVGSATTDDDIRVIAADIRRHLRFDIEQRGALRTWTQALSCFIDQVEEIGIIVMVNGVVGNNPHRRLHPEEFRGFAMVDERAPIVFINGADSISAKTFTLAHELAHIWLGSSGVTDSELFRLPNTAVERWCNQVAAEVLVPEEALAQSFDRKYDLLGEINRLARVFKVSTLVILRRLSDLGYLGWQSYRKLYSHELQRLLVYERRRTESGGNFYVTLSRRVSPRLARALIASVFEGHTLFRDALHMLGISKMDTFKKFAETLR